MYCMYPGHFFLQTINSPCDIFRVFQRVEHESYLLGTKSHLCKKYVCICWGNWRDKTCTYICTYFELWPYFTILSKNYEAKMLPLWCYQITSPIIIPIGTHYGQKCYRSNVPVQCFIWLAIVTILLLYDEIDSYQEGNKTIKSSD